MKKIIFNLPVEECSYAIMGADKKYVHCIRENTITMCDRIEQAIWFYNESSAYQLCLELQTQTNLWFGVVVI